MNAWLDARYIIICIGLIYNIYIYVTYIIYNTYIYIINKTIHIIIYIYMYYVYIYVVLMGFIWILESTNMTGGLTLLGFDEVLTNQSQMLHGAGRFTYNTGPFLG